MSVVHRSDVRDVVITRQPVVSAMVGKGSAADGVANEASTNDQLQQLETAMDTVSTLLDKFDNAVSAADVESNKASDDQRETSRNLLESSNDVMRRVVTTLEGALPATTVDKLKAAVNARLVDVNDDVTARAHKILAGQMDAGLDERKCADIIAHLQQVAAALSTLPNDVSERYNAGLGDEENVGSGASGSGVTESCMRTSTHVSFMFLIAWMTQQVSVANGGTARVLHKILDDVTTMAKELTDIIHLVAKLTKMFIAIMNNYKALGENGGLGASKSYDKSLKLLTECGFDTTLTSGNGGQVNRNFADDNAALASMPGVSVVYPPYTEASLIAAAQATGGLPSVVINQINALPPSVWSSLDAASGLSSGMWTPQVLEGALQNPSGSTTIMIPGSQYGGYNTCQNSNLLAFFFNSPGAGELLSALNTGHSSLVPSGQMGFNFSTGAFSASEMQSLENLGCMTVQPDGSAILTLSSLTTSMTGFSTKLHQLEAIVLGGDPSGVGTLATTLNTFNEKLNSNTLSKLTQILNTLASNMANAQSTLTQTATKLLTYTSQVMLPEFTLARKAWSAGDF